MAVCFKSIFRRELSAAAIALSMFGQSFSAAATPNIVAILTDDQGWGDLSLHGNTNLSTPNVDSLARDGAMFERFYVSPVCSPTRAEFLTGRWHPRGGVHSTSTGGERLDLDERTIAQFFQAAGYATAAFGKWHNGSQNPYHPNARGFDEFYGFASGHWGEYFSPELERNGRLTRGDGYIIDDFTNHAIRFIEQNKDRPFFCYVPFNTPHSPMQVPDRFYDKFAGADLAMRARDPGLESMDMTRAALAMCENIDWNTGRILQALVDLDLAENTIVLYFCDNGPNYWRWNGEMKGRKGSTDEGGVRSPLLVRWPGRIAPGTVVPQIAAAIDLLPTLAELAGIPLEGGKPLDGRSLAPLLLGKAIDWTDRIVFSHWNRRVSARTQRWRLDSQGALFDMLADPAQDRNVAAEHPEIAARLRRAVEEWKSSVLAELERDDRPFTVGYPPGPTTRLPARDGVPHGNVKRSASAPNCSYFTNWTSERDRMTWDIDVAASGDYQASVYYACASEDVGSVVELRCGHSRIEAVVAEAHDPPLVGKEHDRASRGHESYVKDFKPMPLGVIRLEQGRAELILQAKKVAGSQAMDVRYIELTRLEGE